MLACAFLGGVGSLLLQASALKLLSVHIGTSTGAVALVLAACLAGLGIGYAAAGWVGGTGAPVRGMLMAAMFSAAAFALLSPWVLRTLDGLLGRGPLSFHLLAAFAWLFLCILPIGGSVLLLYRLARPRTHERRTTLGLVLGWNTAGGVAGALLPSFFLFPRAGVTRTFLMAAGTLALGGLLVFWLGGGTPTQEKKAKKEGEPKTRHELPGGMAVPIAASAAAGFAGMALQGVWERLLAIFLPNRTYSFGLVLALYLLGYALGGMWAAARVQAKREHVEGKPAKILFVLSLFTIVTPLFVVLLPALLFQLKDVMTVPWRQALLPPSIVASLLVTPPALCMGALPPFLLALCPPGKRHTGSEAGTILGAGTMASVLGSLVSGFLLIPSLGTLRAALCCGALYAAASLSLVFATRRGGLLRPASLLPATALALCIAGLFLPSALPKPLPVSVFREAGRDDRLLFYRESRDGTACVVEDGRSGARSAFVNNNVVCGTAYEGLKTVRALAHLPMLLHPSPKKVLVIGFGMGVTAGNVLTYPVERVDCVELCPEITAAAGLFEQFNRSPLGDRRLTLHPGDGRAWLKREGGVYDVITCDPTHPALGSGNLYTREFFSLASAHLSDGGVFVQYCPLRMISTGGLRALVSTLREVFPESAVWYTSSHAVLLGSKRPILLDPAEWSGRLAANPALPDLRRSSLSRVEDCLAILLLGPGETGAYAGGAAVVTDDRPVLEFPPVGALDPTTFSGNLTSLLALRGAGSARALLPEEARKDEAFSATLDRFYSAKTLLMQADAARGRGDLEEASRLLSRARTTNWDDAEIKSAQESLLAGVGSAAGSTPAHPMP